jgi:hypothetical protein
MRRGRSGAERTDERGAETDEAGEMDGPWGLGDGGGRTR